MTEEIFIQEDDGKIKKISSSSTTFMGVEAFFVFVFVWVSLCSSSGGIELHVAIGMILGIVSGAIYFGLYYAFPRIMPILTSPIWGLAIAWFVLEFSDLTWALVVGGLVSVCVYCAHKAGQEYLNYRG